MAGGGGSVAQLSEQEEQQEQQGHEGDARECHSRTEQPWSRDELKGEDRDGQREDIEEDPYCGDGWGEETEETYSRDVRGEGKDIHRRGRG